MENDVNMSEEEIISQAELTPGFPGTGELSRAERLACRADLDMDEAELALTLLFSILGELEPNRIVYRREWPAEQSSAAYVRLTGEADEASTDFRNLSGVFAGRETVPVNASRTVLPGLFRAMGQLPIAWTTVSGGGLSQPVIVAELKLAKPAEIASSVANGRRTVNFRAEFYARICTALPRGIGGAPEDDEGDGDENGEDSGGNYTGGEAGSPETV